MTGRYAASRSTCASAIDDKIDLFMQSHVLPRFTPDRIKWWLSMSGGKDSFSMALGLRRWYERANVPLRAEAFHVQQWGVDASVSARKTLDWLPFKVLDASSSTLAMTGYQHGQQAPCRRCSDARRLETDRLVFPKATDSTEVHLVARGLHLSDIAVSLLWRYLRGRDPSTDLLGSGKGRPIARLASNVFLAKPLCYVREYESSEYASVNGFVPQCCGCPGYSYPSRRDIVEETAAEWMRSGLWEFSVPGVDQYLGELLPGKGDAR